MTSKKKPIIKSKTTKPRKTAAKKSAAESKRTTQSLREISDRFMSLADSIPGYMAYVNAATLQYEFVNKAFERSFDLPREKIIGSHIKEIIGEANYQFALKYIDEVRTGRSASYENSFNIASGKRWINVNYSPVFDANGQVISIAVSSFDVTERRQTEEALRASEARLHVIFEHANDAIHIVNADDEIIDVNSRMCELMGYSREELLKMHIADLQAPECRMTGNVIQFEMEKYGNSLFERVNIHRDGRRIPVEISVSRIESPQGDLYVSVLRDIAERKQGEDMLRRSEENLKKAQHYSHVGSWTWNIKSNQLEWSNEMYSIFGINKESFTGNLADVIARSIHPDDREKVNESNRNVSEQGKVVPLEYRVVREDGTIRVVWGEAGELILDEAGKPALLSGIVQDITERKQVEDTLRASEEKYRLLVDNMNAGVFQTMLTGEFIQMNRAVAEMAGYDSITELMSKSATCLYADMADRIRLKDALFEYGEIKNMEIRSIRKDQTQYWISMNAVLLQDKDGKPEKILGIVNDITERKQAEVQTKAALEALRASEEKYRVLFDVFPLGITIANKDGKILESNREAERLLGISKEEQEHRTISGAEWKLIRPDGSIMQPEEYASVRALKENRLIENVEMGILKENGVVTWINVTATPLGNSEVVIAYHDITEHRRMEDALQKSEEHYRLLFDNMTEGFAFHELIFDERGEPCDYRFLDINRAFENLTGLKREKLIGKGQREALPEEDSFWFEMYCKVALTGESIRIEHYSPSLQRHYEVYAYCPAPNQFAVVFMDITERKRAEEKVDQLNTSLERRVKERTAQLEEAQEQLVRQERLAVLGQMAGSVGHELRNPLGVISNAVYFLKMAQPDANEKVKEYLNLIERQTDISNKIISDLLDFTRVKSAGREPVSVSQLIHQTLEHFPTPASVQVILDLPDDLPKAYADAHHVVQILGNLTLNACQAMLSTTTQGGKLTISTRIQDEMIRISVQDTGLGISPENMRKLFEPLFTTKPKGIGLGLAVSRKLVEANDGRIEVQSEIGVGSTFTVCLPLYRSAS